MSRPFRNVFALCLAASSFGFYGCGTIYTPMYSNQNTHFKPPEVIKKDGTKQKTAQELMDETDKANAAAAAQGANPLTVPADAGGLPPAGPAPVPDAGAIPGMNPAPATPPATPPPAQ